MRNKKEKLFNKKGRDILKKELQEENFERITASFYKYFSCDNPRLFRDTLYRQWDILKVFGRVYIAKEGINAQVSVPKYNWNDFLNNLDQHKDLKDISIKQAIQDGKSFYKLTIKVREELVAYGISNNSYSMDRVGNHLNSEEYNLALDDPETIIVDMRNYYESEIGHFKHAIIPNVETSKELLPEIKRILKGHEDDKVLLYCTGGIRCEKASAFLLKEGFNNVNQLQGGIIQYAHDIKEKGIESKFIGKNFVFDNRLSEQVTDDIISKCHICGNLCDDHTDCKNDACHILFIQCNSCSINLDGCCSKDCQDFAALPIEEQRIKRKNPDEVVSKTFFDSRIKPRLEISK
tara:strand:- start:94 stop:1140 length:1047 start_codon:yes stop_codon:yes gene_type:complete